MNVKQKVSFFPFLMLAVALIIVLRPLIGYGFFISDDGEWMVIRLSAFYQSLADHQFPVRFLGRLNNSYGYPVANFLYPGFLYIGSLLHFIGFSFVDSIKIILGGSVIGTATVLFLWLRKSFSRFSSVLGTLGFVGAPYLLFDLYKRGSVGEILAFFPAALGIYSIETNRKWIFPAAVAFLIVSHNTLALLFLSVFIVLILVRKKFEYVALLALGGAIAAFFWIPAIMEKKFVRFDTVQVSDPFSYLLTPGNFWLVGLAGMTACTVMLLHRGKVQSRKSGRIFIFMFFVSVLLASPFGRFIWQIEPFASLIQFPYRMLAVGTILTPWLVAAVSERYVRQKAQFTFVLIFILAIPTWYQLQNITAVNRPEGYYTTNEGTTTVHDEYMPRWAEYIPDSRSAERLIIKSGRGTIVYEYLNTQRIVANIEASEESILRLNTIYYPGWGVLINDKPMKISYQNPNGFMEVSVPVGKHRFLAEFRETVPRFLADIISLVGIVGYGVFVIRMMRR